MNARPKRAYQKPTIERIDLVGEESAAVPNCKRTTGGGMNQTYPIRAGPREAVGGGAETPRGHDGELCLTVCVLTLTPLKPSPSSLQIRPCREAVQTSNWASHIQQPKSPLGF